MACIIPVLISELANVDFKKSPSDFSFFLVIFIRYLMYFLKRHAFNFTFITSLNNRNKNITLLYKRQEV
jgi:hypothetical protein